MLSGFEPRPRKALTQMDQPNRHASTAKLVMGWVRTSLVSGFMGPTLVARPLPPHRLRVANPTGTGGRRPQRRSRPADRWRLGGSSLVSRDEAVAQGGRVG